MGAFQVAQLVKSAGSEQQGCRLNFWIELSCQQLPRDGRMAQLKNKTKQNKY